MRISPELGGLRADPSPLFAAAAAFAGLGASEELLRDLARYGAGEPMDRCATLEQAFDPRDGLVRRWIDEAMVALRGAPLGQLPWRHFSNGVLHSVVLAARASASVSLVLIDGRAWTQARDPAALARVAFQPGDLTARVLAGEARARIVRNRSDDPRRAELDHEAVRLGPGSCYALDGAREALAFDTIEGGWVALRLHRAPREAAPARQYDLDSGALVHQAASSRGDSRAEMAMALLRAMDRTDAAPTIAARAREGEAGARWQALRECLALDAETGVRELIRAAGRDGDPLAAPARALLDTLAARDPAFAQAREALLCPA